MLAKIWFDSISYIHIAAWTQYIHLCAGAMNHLFMRFTLFWLSFLSFVSIIKHSGVPLLVLDSK